MPPLEGDLAVDQLHVQLVVGDLALADGQGLLLAAAVVAVAADIVGRGAANDRAQGLDDRRIGHLGVLLRDLTENETARRIHDHRIANGEVLPLGVKIVGLSGVPEFHRHNDCHSVLQNEA